MAVGKRQLLGHISAHVGDLNGRAHIAGLAVGFLRADPTLTPKDLEGAIRSRAFYPYPAVNPVRLLARTPFSESAAQTRRADFNKDGKEDLLYRNVLSGQVYRFLMDGFAITDIAVAYNQPDLNWQIVGNADFDGNGVSDLAWRNTSTGQVFITSYGSNGQPTSEALVITEPSSAWKIVHTPDLNGDGKADLLWWNSSTGQVWAMLMDGPTIRMQGSVYTEPNTAWTIVATGDYAGSGKANQLLWRNSGTGQLYLMTVTVSGGSFTQSGATIYAEPNTAWKVIASADFNGDGKSDILYRNELTGALFMLLMNGGSVLGGGTFYTEPNTQWKVVSTGDYNGDGRADLLWQNDSTGQVFMMLMNGTAIVLQSNVYTEPNTAWRLLGPWEYGQAAGILQ
jgi:peptidyl-Asp metalloendopeptidase